MKVEIGSRVKGGEGFQEANSLAEYEAEAVEEVMVSPDGSWAPLWFGNERVPDEANRTYGTARTLLALRELKNRGFSVAVETNGTQPAPLGLDWICVSPKAGADLVLRTGHELKLVFPQEHPDGAPERFAQMDFTHFFLQPLDAKDDAVTRANTASAIAYCLAHPSWRLSVQTHKAVGIR